MTKNQKILMGCGGAGCLGIIILAVVVFGILGYTWSQITPKKPITEISIERESAPAAGNTNTNANTTVVSFSEDEKHRLFQAAGVTKDQSLILDVTKRTGLLNADGTPTAAFQPFVKEHFSWARNNMTFIRQVSTPEQARAYVNRQLSSTGSSMTAPPPPAPRPLATSTAPTVSGGVLNSKATSLPQPPYPPAAKAVGAQGLVPVQVTVDETGSVTSAQAGSGHPLLRQAAEQAARQAKFAPTMLSGRAVKVSGILTYNFTLQ